MPIKNIIEKAEKQFPVDQNITDAIKQAVSNISGGNGGYPLDNPSGFITTGDLVGLELRIAGDIVYTTGNQTINGLKTFTNSGIFLNGIQVGNNSLYLTENSIDGGYNASNGIFTDGLLGIQYSGYYSGDPEWFKTATLRPIINELVLTGVSASGTYARVSSVLNQGTSYFQGPNGWGINYYSQFPAEESYWYLTPDSSVQHYTSSDLETWSLAQSIQAWDGGATYNINDIVSYDGSAWICKAYAPVGYGPFGGYIDGTENGTDYWDELPATQTSTVTQTQNSENSTNFGVSRALSNGTSWEWVGYFVPQVTEDYNFYLYADDDAYFWIGDNASNGYTSGNADIVTNTNNALENLPLNSGQSYPVRLQWGHKLTPTTLGLSLQYQIPNLSFSSYDFSGVFFQNPVGKGFFIDAVSGDASFAGNVQANSATFNTRPTVNGTGVLLSGEAAKLPDTLVYTTGNQTISGSLSFESDNYFFDGANVYFVNNTGIVSGEWGFTNLPTVNGTGVLLSGEAYGLNNPSGYITSQNVVYTTGGQTISGEISFEASEYFFDGANVYFVNNTGIVSGEWRFTNRPTVNGTGVLLSGEASELPTTIVYTTGNQVISGIKFFSNETVFKDNLLYLSQASGQISGAGYTGYYDGGQFLGRVKLSQNNTRLVNVGNTWVAKGSSRDWRSIAISSDGKYQSAVAYGGQMIYISSDYGNTWTAKDSNRFWSSIAMSSDGKYQSAVVDGGQIYISNDYGATWIARESVRSWYGIAISSDGKYQSAVVYSGQIYVSSDYGNTWTAKESARFWNGIAISSDGKYQSAVENGGGGGGQIYISNNYGNTWTAKESGRSWRAIAISSDGKYQSTVVTGGQIYISNNYGNTWTAKGFNTVWVGIAMSSDGKYQSAVVNSGLIYVSSDYGNTWAAKGSNTVWSSIAMSSDGKYQSAVVASGQIYVSVADELIDGSFTADNVYGNNLIYTTGNQTISGVKTFDVRPTVNGENILLSGDTFTGVTVLITSLLYTGENITYTTGDQTISGIKTFDVRPTVNGSGVFLTEELRRQNFVVGTLTSSVENYYLTGLNDDYFLDIQSYGGTGNIYLAQQNLAKIGSKYNIRIKPSVDTTIKIYTTGMSAATPPFTLVPVEIFSTTAITNIARQIEIVSLKDDVSFLPSLNREYLFIEETLSTSLPPDIRYLTGESSFVRTSGNQTIGGAKTFDGSNIIFNQSNIYISGSGRYPQDHLLHFCHSSTSPTDATRYWIGQIPDLGASTSADTDGRSFSVPVSGTVKSMSVNHYVGTNFGNGLATETGIFWFVNLTTQESGRMNTGVASNLKISQYTDNINPHVNVRRGDQVSIAWITPTWANATNPSAMRNTILVQMELL
jgi:hypothetical protein